MNWEFHSVHETDSKELVKEFSEYAAESVERWIYTLSLTALKEKQPESSLYTEFPRGFYHEGVSYRFNFRLHGAAEYDVTVQQTSYPKFTPRPSPPLYPESSRLRYIDCLGPIC